MLSDDRERTNECFQTRIVLTFNRKCALARGNRDEGVVCAGVAVNRDAVKTRVSYTLGDLGQYVRRHARIGGNKTQHCGHARLNHARPLANARHRNELTVNERLRGKRLCTVSVVMMACAASIQLFGARLSTALGSPARSRSIGKGSMMTPVENTSVSSGLQSRS